MFTPNLCLIFHILIFSHGLLGALSPFDKKVLELLRGNTQLPPGKPFGSKYTVFAMPQLLSNELPTAQKPMQAQPDIFAGTNWWPNAKVPGWNPSMPAYGAEATATPPQPALNFGTQQFVPGKPGLLTIQNLPGVPGVRGIQDAPFGQGLQDVKGLEGLVQGLQGGQFVGVQGLQNFQGIQDGQGIQGLQGIQGGPGIQGLQEIQGGQFGLPGFQNAPGIQGNQGIQGGQFGQDIQGQLPTFSTEPKFEQFGQASSAQLQPTNPFHANDLTLAAQAAMSLQPNMKQIMQMVNQAQRGYQQQEQQQQPEPQQQQETSQNNNDFAPERQDERGNDQRNNQGSESQTRNELPQHLQFLLNMQPSSGSMQPANRNSDSQPTAPADGTQDTNNNENQNMGEFSYP